MLPLLFQSTEANDNLQQKRYEMILQPEEFSFISDTAGMLYLRSVRIKPEARIVKKIHTEHGF